MATSVDPYKPRWLNLTLVPLRSPRYILLLSCLFAAGANSLFFTFVEQPSYDHRMNMLAAAIFWGLALLLPVQSAFNLVCHAGMLTAVSLMTYITLNTGGINSPAMVWMTILAVPALMLLGRNGAFFWMGIIISISLIEFAGVTQGWIDGQVLHSEVTSNWAFLDKITVAISLMLAVNFFDRMHHRQMREVEHRNLELEATHTALIQAQAHKDEFIASVGHELRTPMNAILGLNNVLQSELADEPANAEIASMIRESTSQLLSLVNDILDFSQLEAGRLSLVEKPVDLVDCLNQVLSSFQGKAREKNLRLTLGIDPTMTDKVMLDGHRLQQVLNNLLDNALKFTSSGQVSLKLTQVNQVLRFEVQDTGLGIPPDRQAIVFKQFEHADVQTNRAYGGTGLGLAICDRLVRLQGGHIGVNSSLGQGSVFWFELPLIPAITEPPHAPSGPSNAGDFPDLRFLLVDDNAVNLMVAKLVLLKYWPTAQVTTATSGEQALALLEQQHFDVVLMDMVMPGMDGLEATRQVRMHPRSDIASLVVIGLTANATPRDKERCLESGMNDVLVKPMEPVLVQSTISHWVKPMLDRRQQRSMP